MPVKSQAVVFGLACVAIFVVVYFIKYLIVIGALVLALAFGGWVAYKMLTQKAPT